MCIAVLHEIAEMSTVGPHKGACCFLLSAQKAETRSASEVTKTSTSILTIPLSQLHMLPNIKYSVVAQMHFHQHGSAAQSLSEGKRQAVTKVLMTTKLYLNYLQRNASSLF